MAWIMVAQGRSGQRALRRWHGLATADELLGGGVDQDGGPTGSPAAVQIRTVGRRAPWRWWPMAVGSSRLPGSGMDPEGGPTGSPGGSMDPDGGLMGSSVAMADGGRLLLSPPPSSSLPRLVRALQLDKTLIS
ncbi:hypothetical protein E2562_001084 [Oryza meyeriana var. granulata]|uniref:Uncharacterized protein n=1 Tax=Oryza meyeriana var. granulata TaxID=110450 RepID=A0A6G1ED67_9ORYZ|nr:hypothetical protein E2562_001084 [Oryza meyeriana var. granulata]